MASISLDSHEFRANRIGFHLRRIDFHFNGSDRDWNCADFTSRALIGISISGSLRPIGIISLSDFWSSNFVAPVKTSEPGHPVAMLWRTD
jgi:hypothetical protein